MTGHKSDIGHSSLWETFISKGCNEAFSKIYYDHYDALYYIGTKYTSDIQIVEGSIQNVFIYLLNNRNKLKPVTNVGGYLLKSFRNRLLHDLKKQKKLILSSQLTDAQFNYYNKTEQNFFEKEESKELHNALRQSINKLSAKQQEIIYLRYDCELSYEEISSILEISTDSCYKSIYRSIKTIKADIERMQIKGNDFLFLFICRLNAKCY